jgi:predicted nucleic acid-binding protein
LPGYFLDTSALAKLYHPEIGSDRMEALVQRPSTGLIIAQLSLVEIQSVFAIKVRTGTITEAELDLLRGLFFSDLVKGRFEVAFINRRHFESAEALIKIHAVTCGLRAMDAIQLAVALDLHGRGVATYFVAADNNLCRAAALEGLTVFNPSED